MSADSAGLVEVALPVPLFQTFTYALEKGSSAVPPSGSRLVVPFRNRREIGICLGPAVSDLSPGRLRRIIDVPDSAPALSEQMMALCRWISDYYVVPLGLAMRAALPVAMTGAANPQPSRRTHRVVSLREDLPTLTQRDKAFARAPQQRALFELLESLGGPSTVEHLLEQLAFSPSVLRALERRGLVRIGRETVERDPFAEREVREAPRHAPTPDQSRAVQALRSAKAGEAL